MSEPEQDETTPRFSKAMIGRVLAVGLFVALGTFAVIQTMQSKGEIESSASQTDGSTDNDTDASADASADIKLGSTEGDVAKPESKIAASTFQSVSNSFNAPKTAPQKTFTPPAGGLKISAAPKLKANTTGGAFGSPPPAKSFDTSKSFDPSKAVTLPSSAAKPPTERYAQVESGVPIIGNQGGFGTLRKPTSQPTGQQKMPATNFGESGFGEKLDDAARSVVDSAKSIKTDATGAAESLLKQVGDKKEQAFGAIQQNLGGGFAPPNRKLDSSNGFAPPIVTNPNTKPDPFVTPNNKSNFSSRAVVPPANINPGLSQIDRGKSAFEPNRNLAPLSSERNQTGFGANPPTSQPNGLKSLNANPRPKDPFAPPESRFGGPPRSNVNSSSTSSTAPSIRQNSLSATSRPESSRPLTQFPNRQPAFDQRPSEQSTFEQRPAVSAQPISTSLGSRSAINHRALGTPSNVLTRDVPGERNLDGVQAPALTVEKRSPGEIQVNQTAEFELIVKNVGRATAENIQVFDEIPSGTAYEGATPEPASVSQSQGIRWEIGSLQPGQEKRIQLQLKPVRPGEIGSVAYVTFSTQASMRTLVTKPVLEIVHQAKPSYLIGDSVVLDVVVSNKGDGPAKNVIIQQDVPPQLEFPEGLPGGNRGIEYEVGTLLPGKSRRVQLALKAAEVGRVQNVMFASAAGGLQARHEIPLEVVAPKLVANTDGPTRRFLQRNVTHTFSVANQGTANATNVELIARLPNGLKFLQANNQGRYDANTNAVYWSLAELAKGIEAKVELKTSPVSVGNQPIKFEASADLGIRSNVEQPLSVEHLVDVFFDIDDLVDPIEIGSDTSYRVRVVNQGTKAATNVALQVEFPTGIQPTKVDGSLRHSIRGQQIAFEPINSMSPGDELSFVIHGRGQSAGDHRVIVNMQTDGRSAPVSKQETTRVYSDR